MPARTNPDAAVITTAPHGRTLDVETRTKRYLWTMAVRTACFFAFLVVPGWWKVVALVGAAVLPAVAVLLANNADHRPPPTVAAEEPPSLALPGGTVVSGTVEEDL